MSRVHAVMRGTVALLSLATLILAMVEIKLVAGLVFMTGVYSAVPIGLILLAAVVGLFWGSKMFFHKIVESV